MPQLGNNDEFYSRFHEQLKKSQSWPGRYMFKFVKNVNFMWQIGTLLFFRTSQVSYTFHYSKMSTVTECI